MKLFVVFLVVHASMVLGHLEDCDKQSDAMDSSSWQDFMQPEKREQQREFKEEEEWPLKNKEWNLPQVPRDSQGFVRSFGLDQEKQIKEFLEEFGFVVIDGILDIQQIEDTIKEIWDELEGKIGDGAYTPATADILYYRGAELERLGQLNEAVEFYRKAFKLKPELEDETVAAAVLKKTKPRVDRNDPRTWSAQYWAVSSIVGFLGNEISKGQMAWKNRLNENLYKAFQMVLGRSDLWVQIDRYGIMRPTRNVPLERMPEKEVRTDVSYKGLKVEDKTGWKSISNWTHWDLNPWKWTNIKGEALPYVFEDFFSENNGVRSDGTLKVQGILNLIDNRPQDGGFCLVPGFHKHIEEWARLTQDTTYAESCEGKFSLVDIPEDDSLHKYLVPINVRAGSLIVWRGEMPHCNYPNDSERFRMNQYVRMHPAQEDYEGWHQRKVAIRKILPTNIQTDERGMKLLGLESWKSK